MIPMRTRVLTGLMLMQSSSWNSGFPRRTRSDTLPPQKKGSRVHRVAVTNDDAKPDQAPPPPERPGGPETAPHAVKSVGGERVPVEHRPVPRDFETDALETFPAYHKAHPAGLSAAASR